MNECQKCAGRSELYLCRTCVKDLRSQLLNLPTLVAYLEDSAHGQTKLSNEASRALGYASRTPSLDNRAAYLLSDIRSTIGQWATALAKEHALVISPPVTWAKPVSEYRYTVRDYAVFLAAHCDRLARDPDVGELCASLRNYVARGLKIVNRPTPPQFCGPCPAIITDHRHCTDCGKRDHECATRLLAARGALEVTCPGCGAQHSTERLITHLLARADDFRCTIPELHRVLRMLDTPVSMRTLYHWALPRVGRLKPAGYLRPDKKRIGPVRHTAKDTPVYRVADARKQAQLHKARKSKGGKDEPATRG